MFNLYGKTDAQICHAVRTQFAATPGLENLALDIETLDGVVTLRGPVKSFAQAGAAERVVENLRGVKAVVNELGLLPTAATASADRELATAVLKALQWSAEIPQGLTVEVDSGWVTIGGAVSSSEACDAAHDVVGNLQGVRGITNEIIVTQ